MKAKNHISILVAIAIMLCAILPHFAGGVVYAEKIAGPVITKITPLSNEGATIKFKFTKGARSYHVQAKAWKSGKWEGYGRYGAAALEKPEISIILKNKKGKTVYVRMRAKIKTGKTILMSDWGKAKAVKLPKKAKPGTAFDKPYGKATIIEYAKTYGESIGMTWEDSLTKDNCSWEAPASTSPVLSGERLKRLIRNATQRVKGLQADNDYQPGEFRFKLYLEPVDGGEYKMYFLMG
jgi:hypothetical protein